MEHRVHKIVCRFDGPSGEKMSVLNNFLLQNTNLVSVLNKKSAQILLVIFDRTDEFHNLCGTMRNISIKYGSHLYEVR